MTSVDNSSRARSAESLPPAGRPSHAPREAPSLRARRRRLHIRSAQGDMKFLHRSPLKTARRRDLSSINQYACLTLNPHTHRRICTFSYRSILTGKKRGLPPPMINPSLPLEGQRFLKVDTPGLITDSSQSDDAVPFGSKCDDPAES